MNDFLSILDLDSPRIVIEEVEKKCKKDVGLEGEIKSVPVDILREFLLEDVECVRPSSAWVYSESITFEVCASV